MESGQSSSSATGDDYDIWNTIYKAHIESLAGKILKTPMLRNFFTLIEKNVFGNYARFTSASGRYFSDPYLSSSLKEPGGAVVSTSDDADAVSKFGEYIIDHWSGIAYLRTDQTAAVWDTAISNANGLSASNYDDWHMCSRIEVEIIRNTKNAVSSTNNQPLGYFPFFKTAATNYFTSSTDYNANTFAYILNNTQGAISINAKSGSLAYLVARKHF